MFKWSQDLGEIDNIADESIISKIWIVSSMSKCEKFKV